MLRHHPSLFVDVGEMFTDVGEMFVDVQVRRILSFFWLIFARGE